MAGPIAVYGATGYTGRLIVAELKRLGLETVLAGRDPAGLAEVAAEAGADARARVAQLDDPDTLRHAIGDCAAVVNAAGPFAELGLPVIQAAVDTGTHYVDVAGEQAFVKQAFEQFADAATAAEVAVVPGMGFNSGTGDLLCHLVAHPLEPVRDLLVAYDLPNFGTTPGALRSALGALHGPEVTYENGEWRQAKPAPSRGHVTFPSPVGRQTTLRFPSAEVVTVPRHVDVRRVTSRVSVRTLAAVPGVVADLVPLAMPLASLAMRTPLRGMASALIQLVQDGPSPTARSATHYTVLVLARAQDGRTGRGVVTGNDPYLVAAGLAVRAAAKAAQPGYDRTGVLAPAAAFDAREMLDSLADLGLSYSLE